MLSGVQGDESAATGASAPATGVSAPALGVPPLAVRALSLMLVLELATYTCLVVLALISAAIGYAARNKGGFGDLAAVLSLVVAGCSLAFAGLAVAGWLALRARRPVAVVLGLAVHVLPLVLMAVAVRSVGTLLGLSVVWSVVAFAGILLALLPSTRAWLAPAPPRAVN